MNSWWSHELLMKYSCRVSPPYVHELAWKWSHCKRGCVYCYWTFMKMWFALWLSQWTLLRWMLHEHYPMNFITNNSFMYQLHQFMKWLRKLIKVGRHIGKNCYWDTWHGPKVVYSNLYLNQTTWSTPIIWFQCMTIEFCCNCTRVHNYFSCPQTVLSWTSRVQYKGSKLIGHFVNIGCSFLIAP